MLSRVLKIAKTILNCCWLHCQFYKDSHCFKKIRHKPPAIYLVLLIQASPTRTPFQILVLTMLQLFIFPSPPQQNKNYLQSFWGATFLASGWSEKLRCFWIFFCQEIQEVFTPFSVNRNFPLCFSLPFIFFSLSFFSSNFRELITWTEERISRTLSTWLV